MNKKEFLQLIDELLELDSGTLKGDEDLDSLSSWDSLAVLGFITLVDKKFDLVLNPDNIVKAKTINDLICMIDNRLSKSLL
ncbi:MAG: acyl carrier protein [Rickettsiales bacterium]|nr:acyl carrier protein [Rickettsiales bacterium]